MKCKDVNIAIKSILQMFGENKDIVFEDNSHEHCFSEKCSLAGGAECHIPLQALN